MLFDRAFRTNYYYRDEVCAVEASIRASWLVHTPEVNRALVTSDSGAERHAISVDNALGRDSGGSLAQVHASINGQPAGSGHQLQHVLQRIAPQDANR